jgi:hypothetical protein
MRVPTLVLVIALTAACASQPAAPTAPAPAAVAAAAKPVAPAATDATDATAKADVQPAVLSGYKPKTRNGETVYCKKVARIGSNFATETCMTAAEAEQLERQAELDRTLLRKNQTICGTAGCGAR